MIDELEALLRIVVATTAGAIVGLEREIAQKPAGVRTYAIVALGASVFTLVGLMAFGDGDPGSRVAATIITGVGFLGAGAIIQRRGDVDGLTTAAGIWGVAAIGMAYGTGLFILATGATVLMLSVLRVVGIVWAQAGDDHEDGTGGRSRPRPSGLPLGVRVPSMIVR